LVSFQISLKTVMGISLDLITMQLGKKAVFETFTMDRFSSIAMYKTSYYSFIFPIALSMHMVCTI
jgi:hypothetical protein